LNGNHQAEELFFEKYKKIVKDFLRTKFTKYSTDDIDDCVSIILIKVFYSLNKYNPEKSSVKTWVLTIAKHVMIDTWRKNSTYSASSTTHSSYDYNVSPFDNVSNCLAYTNTGTYCSSNSFENSNAISYLSTQLSPTDFTLLDMKYVQGYNYNEIGSEFQISSSTVSNKINYIKTKLKKNILEDVFD